MFISNSKSKINYNNFYFSLTKAALMTAKRGKLINFESNLTFIYSLDRAIGLMQRLELAITNRGKVLGFNPEKTVMRSKPFDSYLPCHKLFR